MRFTRKQEELRRHLTRWIDRARWSDYIVTDDDLAAYIRHESTGQGEKPEPLAWVKKCEEITIHQLWSEMAEWWCSGWGWRGPLDATIGAEFRERNGSNIWLRRLIAIARGIERRKDFLDALFAYTGFSAEERNKYLDWKFGAFDAAGPVRGQRAGGN